MGDPNHSRDHKGLCIVPHEHSSCVYKGKIMKVTLDQPVHVHTHDESIVHLTNVMFLSFNVFRSYLSLFSLKERMKVTS